MATTRELCVDVPARRRAAAIAAVRALGVMGVQLRDRASGAPPGRVHVLAWLPPTDATAAAAEALAAALGPGARVTWRDVPATWETAPAHPLGRRFVVIGPDEPLADPTGEGRVPLRIDGALAFGDGLHPTTGLCVELLEDTLGGAGGGGLGAGGAGGTGGTLGEGAPAARSAPASVLDVGTGTGILALVASRLGAAPVAAQDIDPLAVWAARRTLADHGAEVPVHEALPGGRYDLVVANLYLAPLLDLLPALAARRAPGGALLLSGFVAAALPDVTAALAAAGLAPADTRVRDGWVALLARG